jgi:hypothetical protein
MIIVQLSTLTTKKGEKMKIDFNQAKINAVKTLPQWCPGFTKAQKKGENEK